MKRFNFLAMPGKITEVFAKIARKILEIIKWLAKKDAEAARYHENIRRAQDKDFRKYYHHNREIR